MVMKKSQGSLDRVPKWVVKYVCMFGESLMKRMFFNGSIALLSGLGVARVYLYVQ